MKRIFLSAGIFSLLSPLGLQAQQLDPDARRVVGSAGDQVASSSLQVSYTIGETVIFKGTSSERIYTQGFQQGPLDPATDFDLGVYNAFSPEGDGRNDTWIIDNIELYPENQVSIYNRWGDLVRLIDAYDNDQRVWDGKSKNGRDLPSGTYFYVIDAGVSEGGEKLVRKGYVQITR